MRRMYSENQLIELIQKYGGDIEKIKEELVGSYVRIMDAPKSTTLNDEQMAQISEGIFINGDFLGFHNPVLFPSSQTGRGWIISTGSAPGVSNTPLFSAYQINLETKVISLNQFRISMVSNQATIYGVGNFNNYQLINKPNNSVIASLAFRKGELEWYIPVAQDNITSGDVVALDSNLGKALIDHLDVEINGYRARYEYTNGNYVVYSSKSEVESGAKLQINMISYNTTNGELSFNQMTFTPDN